MRPEVLRYNHTQRCRELFIMMSFPPVRSTPCGPFHRVVLLTPTCAGPMLHRSPPQKPGNKVRSTQPATTTTYHKTILPPPIHAPAVFYIAPSFKYSSGGSTRYYSPSQNASNQVGFEQPGNSTAFHEVISTSVI
jgi:hypothetical protein